MSSPDDGPEWADEAHLDEVFSTWVPGPPDSASDVEREMAGGGGAVEIPAEDPISDHDLEAALAAALADAEGSAERVEQSGVAEASAPPPPDPPPPPAAPAEPSSPSWLGLSSPPPPAPARDEQGAATDAAGDAVTGPEADADPGWQPDLDPDPLAFQPAPPAAPLAPPEAPARPWTRSDDDILPPRRGRGRRR